MGGLFAQQGKAIKASRGELNQKERVSSSAREISGAWLEEKPVGEMEGSRDGEDGDRQPMIGDQKEKRDPWLSLGGLWTKGSSGKRK